MVGASVSFSRATAHAQTFFLLLFLHPHLLLPHHRYNPWFLVLAQAVTLVTYSAHSVTSIRDGYESTERSVQCSKHTFQDRSVSSACVHSACRYVSFCIAVLNRVFVFLKVYKKNQVTSVASKVNTLARVMFV